ncbi:unnamed protein product [Closterium sp. NIES-53]
MVQQVLQRFDFTYSSPQATPLSTRHSLSALPSDESVEPSGPYPELVGCLITSGLGLVLGGRRPVVLTGHAHASWADDQATQRSSLGYTFSLGSGSVSWRSTRSSSVLGSSCEAEIYAGAMAAQELRWLTYLLTDLGEQPRSPPVLYVDNKAMLALCREHRANTADIFTKALPPGDHQRFCTMLACFALLDWSCDLLFSPTLPMGVFLLVPNSFLVQSFLFLHILWHHRLGHPSLTRLRGMASRVLRAAPHSSEFPLTEAPLQTLHMDVWGPACVRGQGHERYFLLVVDDYSRYTTVFPLRSKGDVTELLIDWIRAARLQLRESFGSDFPVLRLHSDRGGEFSSARLGAFCRAQAIRQTFTLPASPQQNGIAERRIGMVMDVARTSMIHAAAPHFLWPFVVQYTAHELNLQPRVSLPETSPTLRWTGKVGDASAFRVWGSRAFVRDLSADKVPPRAVPCDVTFDESVPYYRLFPYRTAPLPPPPLFLAPGPPPVEPLPPQGPAPSGVSQVDAVEPVEVAVDSGAARGAEPVGAGSGGAESRGAEPGGTESGGAEPGGAASGGAESGGAQPGGAEPWGAESAPVASRSARNGGTGAIGTGGAAAATGVGPAGASGAAGGVGAGVGAAGGSGADGARAAGGVGTGVGPAGGTAGAAGGTGAPGPAGVGAVGAGFAAGTGAATGGTGAIPVGSGGPARPRPYFILLLEQILGLPPSPGPAPPLECPQPVQSQSPVQPPASRPASPVRTTRTSRRAPRPRPPAVPGTHQMALCPSTAPLRVPLPSPPESSLPAPPDPESDSLRASSPTIARLLSTVVTDSSFESTTASALVAELVDFAARCRLDYATGLVAESASVCPPSVGGDCALSTDVLEDRQEEFQCFAAALPHLVSTLIAPEGDPDAPDIPTP